MPRSLAGIPIVIVVACGIPTSVVLACAIGTIILSPPSPTPTPQPTVAPTLAPVATPVVLSAMAGNPAALPNTGGAQSNEAATNMAFVLAAAALAVGTVVFVGSSRKDASEAHKSTADNREGGNN